MYVCVLPHRTEGKALWIEQVSLWSVAVGLRGCYLRGLQGLDLPWELHSMSVEVVHGDGIVPVAQVVLRVGCLLLPPHAAHSQQDGCGESPSQRSRGRRQMP